MRAGARARADLKGGSPSLRRPDLTGDRPVPTALLLEALTPLLAVRLPGARISAISRTTAPYRSSWWLEDLSVSLDDGRILEMVFKDLDRATPGSFAHLAKPAHVLDASREPWVYASVFEPLRKPHAIGSRDRPGEGPPVFWGASSGRGGDVRWLFLERIHGTPLSEIGSADVWRDAAAWLGRFHAVMGSRRGPTGPLLRHDAEIHLEWFRRAINRARERTGPARFPNASWRRIERAHAAAVGDLMCDAGTMIHGEFYPSNILVERCGRGLRIRPVDWEMAGVGPRLLDLAALTCGGWSPRERAGMLRAYRGGMLDAGGKAEPMDRFVRNLTSCRLLLAVQWLGWGAGWSPPLEHRHDWLLEAVRCVEELEAP